MNRIVNAFAQRRTDSARAVIPFIVAGDPSMESMPAVLTALAEAGAGIIEIGVPFSDPIADGPVISEAMRRAIERGATPTRLFNAIAAVRSRVDAAIILMVSVSIVERIGREAFAIAAQRAGVDGIIIPDLDLDQAPSVADTLRDHGMALPMLVAPATGPDRMKRIVACSSGFIYLLARQGVTGAGAANDQPVVGNTAARTTSASDIARRVQELRSLTQLPIACGFGISTSAQVTEVVAHADAAIVGSALVAALADCTSVDKAAARASSFMRELTSAATATARQ